MKRLYVTLDTEMDSNEKWIKSFPPAYTSVTEGIPELLRPIWDELQVHPVYFVSPEVLYEESCCEVLREEIKKGAIIGAHLHPEYIKPDSIWGEGIENTPAQFPCYACSNEVEKEKLQNLTTLIKEKLGVTPVWYRAARFGADIHTIEALRELGYQYDSSVTPYIDWTTKGGPDHREARNKEYFISKQNLYQTETPINGGSYNKLENVQIKEYPVTILGKRWGILGKMMPDNWLFYRWLRPSHMTCFELKSIIKQLVREEIENPVMMFHSMEIMIRKTPYVRNKWMQKYYLWRLRKSLEYAKKSGYAL